MRRALHDSDDPAAQVSRSLVDADPPGREALDNETARQRVQIELIASDNVMSRAVREALGHEIGNKTLEGYPGNRFHGGGEYVDVVERLAIERARKLFGVAYANVQPHSGTQANQAVFLVLPQPGDRILSLDLAAGGPLGHGAGTNLSGRWFDSRRYGADRASGPLDYDEVEARAREVRPALLIAGGSAYPRTIDFERMAGIAEAVEARLPVDMAHIAGLVAGTNLSGRWFDSHRYGVDRASGLLDYDEVEARAREVRPALLIAGGSAYPRTIDFERMAGIAEAVEARLLVDMAHIAGLVAAGAHASPLPHADIVTCTTAKTLRGPRGGLILARSEAFARGLQSAVFPGVQGSLHSNVLAAKAVCRGEALRPEFRDYGRRVVENARTLADRGVGLVGGATDTHRVLLDLASVGILGHQAETALARAGITSNRNPGPFDARSPSKWTGLRLGVSAATTCGFGTADMEVLGECIADLLHAEARSDPGPAPARAGARIARLAQAAGKCGPG